MINDITECTGCGACFSVCPVNAIESQVRELGTRYFVATDRCIKCGRCISICPTRKVFFQEACDHFYSGKSVDKIALKNSSSGVVSYEISKYFIQHGDVVYGAGWSFDDQKVTHQRGSTIDDIKLFQGSKYVQSIISDETYKSIQKDLVERKVLFIGCPCQVAAVRSITNNHPNLYCIDLVCHGVSSDKLLSEQIRLITDKPITYLSFRDGLEFRLKLQYDNRTYLKNGYDVPYYSLYLNFASLRETCYLCKYAQPARVGDITVGDFVENNVGYSMVACSSEKGSYLLSILEGKVQLTKKTIGELRVNHAFFEPTVKSEDAVRFRKLYEKVGLQKAYYRAFRKLVIKRKIRGFLGDKLYSYIKKLTHVGK